MPDTPNGGHAPDARDQVAGAEAPHVAAPQGPGAALSSRGALSRLERELSVDEFAEPGARKLLLEMLFRADNEAQEGRVYEKRYYESNTEVQVLREKVQGRRAFDVLFGFTFFEHLGPAAGHLNRWMGAGSGLQFGPR
jgi:hypothetical protein